jgi:hypothetical protein
MHTMEHEYGIPRDVDEDTAAWFAEGDEIMDTLAAVVHGELRARDVDERWSGGGKQSAVRPNAATSNAWAGSAALAVNAA